VGVQDLLRIAATFRLVCPRQVLRANLSLVLGAYLAGVAEKSLRGLVQATVTVDADGKWIFRGESQRTGTVSKGGGSFKIDHPLDPSNKTLSHSFVESPDMMNIYNGVAKIDAKGQPSSACPIGLNL